MKDIGLVYGSPEQAKPLIIGKDTVYVHTNIQKVEYMPNGEQFENMYCYNEVQYTLAEYLDISLADNQRIGASQAALQEENKQLKAKMLAQEQSSTFLEDCLIEMASVVYA